MATRTITVNLQANASGMVAGFRQAQNAAQGFASQTAQFAQQNRESMEAVGGASMLMGGSLVAGFGKAVTTFASFDKAMSGVQAATHESAANMDLLRDAAVEAGADTAFSAEEAAGAVEELAKAGVSTADILNGGLNGALALAAAGELDVATAAELAASSMTQFGLKGSEIPHIADLLAAGAGKAQGSVQDMGQALNQAGLVANQVGLTIEETTGGLAAFASAGLTGSDAGTSFKSMLQRLTPQSAEASRLMGELGLSAYDSQGNFIGLSEYAGELQNALKDMTAEQRNATLGTLFGSDAVRAASVLYTEGAAGVQEWEDAVNEAGFAAETAGLLQNNLAGDLEKLGGSLDTVFLKSGSGANEVLRELVQSTEDFVDKIGQIPAPVLSAVTGIAGIAGAGLLAGGAFLALAPRVFETVGHFRNLQTSAPKLASGLGKVGKAAGIAGAAFVALTIAKSIDDSMAPATKTVEEFSQSLVGLKNDSGAIDEVFASLEFEEGDRLEGQINSYGDAMNRLVNQGFQDKMQSFGNSVFKLTNSFGYMRDAVAQQDAALAAAVSGGRLDQAAQGFRAMADSAEASGVGLDEVAKRSPEYMDALRQVATNANVALSEQELLNWAMGETPAAMTAAAASSEETATAIGEVGGEAEAAALSLEDIVEALFQMGQITMSSRDSTAAFHEALRAMDEATVAAANGTLGLGAVLNSTATDFDVTTEAGAAANAAFQDVAAQGMTDVEAKAREGMGQPELQANLQGTYDALIRSANGMGIVGGDAEVLARKVLGVPDNVSVESWMSDAAKRMAQDTADAVKGIPSYKRVDVDYVNTTTNIVRSVNDEGHIAEGPGGRGGIGRATGGAIYGPGTGTSDTAGLYALSNGEHVLTAAEVRAMGGQKAVYDFRAQLGMVRSYSGGGSVGYNSVTHNQPVIREYSAPSSTAGITADELLPAMRKAFDGLGHKRVDVSYTGPSIEALTTSIARRIGG